MYQCDLECLVQLCLLMNEKYNREYIWGDKRFDMNNGTEKTKTLTMPDINMAIEIEEEEPDIESGSVDYPIEMEMDGFRVIHDHIDGQPIYDVYDSENHHIGTVHSKSAVSELNEQLEEEESYPVKLQVDGYDVNHYHEGDIPVYEIYDKDGNVMDVAHSTNEMHEITGNGKI